jgi:asparagine synthase (glutamine-hydrolysing)
LFCGRDQIGVVPLHYAAIGNALLVATDIGSLLDHPEVDDSLDEEAIADFLVAGRPRDPAATTFAGIRRVPPAHVLSWAAGEVHCRRYWALAREPLVRFRHPEDYSRAFRDLLDVAVAERLTADKVAVHLTGGMDSTSVAASARLEMTKRGAAPSAIRAVTAVLGGDSGDREGEFASLAAAALGLDVDWVDGSSLPRLAPWATPVVPPVEPTPYQRTTYQFELVRVPSLHARVALSGMAGDCLLWSSPLYWAEWLRHGEVGRLATALVDEVRISHHRPYPGVRAALKRHRVLKAVGSEAVPGWLAHDLATRVNATERMPRSVLPASAMDARAIALETTWPTWFIWSHPSYTGVPVRVRYPLVDLRLVRYALSLPPRPWLVDKRVLRDASSPRLPREITERPKTPLVAAPLPGLDAAALQELAAFVQEVPDLERFVNVKELVAALEVPASAIGHRQEMALAQPLGLAHWLSHRRITRASLDGRLPSAIPFSQEQVGP